MWYNHDIDPESGWMGERDVFSIHGGCGIKKGVKYIANNWIVAPYKHGAHMPSLYLIDKDNEMWLDFLNLKYFMQKIAECCFVHILA